MRSHPGASYIRTSGFNYLSNLVAQVLPSLKVPSKKERALRYLALFIGILFVGLLWILRDSISALGMVGYPGVLLISVVGSGSFILPIPTLASVCALSTQLNPIAVGLLNGIGETTGELSGYAIGYGAQDALKQRRFYTRVQQWMAQRGTVALFIVSILPNPIFDIVGIAAGSTRFPMTRFIITVLIGKCIKGIYVAYACWYGFALLPWVE